MLNQLSHYLLCIFTPCSFIYKHSLVMSRANYNIVPLDLNVFVSLLLVGYLYSVPSYHYSITIIAIGSSIQVLMYICRFMKLMSLAVYGLVLNTKINILDICLTDYYITFFISLPFIALSISVFWSSRADYNIILLDLSVFISLL